MICPSFATIVGIAAISWPISSRESTSSFFERSPFASEWAPDIAFLDLGLPEMDGCQLAIRLRSLPGLAQLKLIALTGYAQEADRERTLEAGFADHSHMHRQFQRGLGLTPGEYQRRFRCR